MYLSFFGLNEKPFAITPDPRYLYLSARHSEALAHLVYGISESGGFVQLTGEVGTGKTTIVRSLLAQTPKDAEIALILNPRMTAPEFLLTICEELGIGVNDAATGSVKDLVDILNSYLLKAHADGRRVVLVVDEAQNLAPDVLEQVRLLTNLETATQKLLQIILVGQPELRDVLSKPELRQLAQRITGRYHLEALSRGETQAYVRHRLRVAGAAAEIFTGGALREVHRVSGGIPRIINVVCDRALLGAFTREEHRVTGDLIRNAASEVYGRPVLHPWVRWLALAGASAGVALLGLALWRAFPPEAAAPAAEPAPAVAAEPAEFVAPPPPVEPPPPSLESLLARQAAGTTTDAAFAALLRLWGVPYEPGSARPCDQVAAQGLQCVAQRGSFAQLRLINRPAILSLADASGAEHQVVIERLDDQGARLAIGSVPYTVSLAELANHWFGEFLVVWRPSQPEVKDLRLGMRGEDVRWLRQGLARIGGLPAETAAGDTFDAEVERLVQEFQRARRLTVDGIAGMQTQLLLDSAIGAPGTPTLIAGPAGGGA